MVELGWPALHPPQGQLFVLLCSILFSPFLVPVWNESSPFLFGTLIKCCKSLIHDFQAVLFMNGFRWNLSIWPWNSGAMSRGGLAHKISFLVSLRGYVQGVFCVIHRERGAMFRGGRKDFNAAMSYLVQRALPDSSPQPYMTRFIHWEISIIVRMNISLPSLLSGVSLHICRFTCM